MFTKSILAAVLLAAPIAFGTGGPARAGETPEQPAIQKDSFTLQRSYFEPDQRVVSNHDLGGLVRMLDRARDIRPVSDNLVQRRYSLEEALDEQAWRHRVSEELKALFK